MFRLTVAIVTKDRPKKLKRCLDSFLKQSIKTDKIFVIDNSIDGNAKSVCDLYKNKLGIEYINSLVRGVPALRNLAINRCETEILSFIDDDCVADNNWVEIIKNSFKDNQTGFVLGQSKTLNIENILALALARRQDYWFKKELERNAGKPGPFCFDTKNAAIRVEDIKKHKLCFDNNLFIDKTDGHSDTDFGLQLKRRKINGLYASEMIVYHEEITGLGELLRKAFYRGKAGFGLYKKWGLKNELVFIPEINIFRWISRIKNWPGEYKKQTLEITNKGLVYKIAIFLLIKAYDWVYLQGFAKRASELKVKLS